jgi:protein-disulfide isomerase
VRWALIVCGLLGTSAWAGGVGTGATYEVVHVPVAAEPVRGPRFALVTVEVYVAFGHAPSVHAAELARRAVEQARTLGLEDVREIVHLEPYGPPGADFAVEAALEAEAQGRFWPYVDHLLADRAPSFSRADLVRAGREVGLDADRLDAALTSRCWRGAAGKRMQDARAAQPPGRLLVNGRPLAGWPTDDALLVAVDQARQHAQGLVADGVPLGRLFPQLVDEQRTVDEGPRPASRPRRTRVTLDLTGAPTRGPSLAPVTVVMFTNLACPACVELATLARRVADKHPGQVRLVFKHWLQPFADTTPAELAAGADLQGRFWPLFDLMVPSSVRVQPLGGLDRLAQRAGIDLDRLRADQRAGLLRARVDRDLDEVRRLRLLYSPSLVVNGIILAGLQSSEMLEQVIEEELDRGLLERLGPPIAP